MTDASKQVQHVLRGRQVLQSTVIDHRSPRKNISIAWSTHMHAQDCAKIVVAWTLGEYQVALPGCYSFRSDFPSSPYAKTDLLPFSFASRLWREYEEPSNLHRKPDMQTGLPRRSSLHSARVDLGLRKAMSTANKIEQRTDQVDHLLQSSFYPEHARTLLSVVLAARRPLTISEFKVVFALTKQHDDGADQPTSYENLEIIEDDDHLESVVYAICGSILSFAKGSVRLSDQSVRDYLTEPRLEKGGEPEDLPSSSHTTSHRLSEISGLGDHSIMAQQTNSVMAKVCLDLLHFDVSEDWIHKVFRNFATGDFRDVVQKYAATRPMLMYAACNWYEHLTLSGDCINCDHIGRSHGAMFDISNPQFWGWFLIACDQVCLSKSITSSPWRDEIVASIWADSESFGNRDRGSFLRSCLRELLPMHEPVAALFYDEISVKTMSVSGTVIDGLALKASDCYHLIDAFHLADGDWEQTSTSKAISAIEDGNEWAPNLLLKNKSTPVLIWTSLKDGKPKALRKALSLTTDLKWLDCIPDYMVDYQGKQPGLVHAPESAAESHKARQREWNRQYHATFHMIIRANTLSCADELFGALAEWVEALPPSKAAAQAMWGAGGFINPVLCRILVNTGAQLDSRVWRDQVTALQIAATFWEHDAIKTLVDLGADTSVVSSDGFNTLHHFCFAQGGNMKEKEHTLFQHRYGKVKIRSSFKTLVGSVLDRNALIHAQDTRGITPLMLSVQTSQTITECLLDAGAMTNQRDAEGRNALMHFFIGSDQLNLNYLQRRTSILVALLVTGADASLSDINGVTAVGYWAQQLLAWPLSHLYAGYNVHNVNFCALDRLGALAWDKSMAECLKPLNIPLAVAARLGNAQLCRYLLANGASANEHGIDPTSVLARNNGSEATDLFEMSWSPLMIAISSKAYVTAVLLMEHGAGVHVEIDVEKLQSYSLHKAGTTLLHFVVADDRKLWHISDMSMATGGASSGCSFEPVGRPDHPVPTMSVWERMAQYQCCANDSRDLGPDDSDDETEMIRHGPLNDSRGANLLPFDKLNAEIGAVSKDPDGLLGVMNHTRSTPVQRQLALMQTILLRGVNVNAQTQEGITPLFVCASNGRVDIAELLLRHGADANIATKTGSTALMWAARRGDKEMAELLIDAGATIDAQVYPPAPEASTCARFKGSGWFNDCVAPVTALAIAAERGHYDVVELLLAWGADVNVRIEHHAHGLLKDKERKRNDKSWRADRKQNSEESDADSELAVDQWAGYISVATALTWARGEVKELLIRSAADSAVEEPIRPCGCEIQSWREDEEYIVISK